MSKAQIKTACQLSSEQTSPKNMPIRHYLSDNESEKDFTSCASIKTAKVPKILQRRKELGGLERGKRNKFGSPKISYISSQGLK